MSYKIIRVDQQLLSVEFIDQVSLEDRINARNEVASFCINRGFTQVFIEMLNSKMNMDLSDIIKYVESFKGLSLPKNLKISGVIDINDKVNKIIEMMLAGEGYKIKLFSQRKDALNWLLEA
jgi:hypothetical protein